MYKLSPQGAEFIQDYEGLRLDAYQDSVGVWTIGWGHTKGVKRGDKINLQKATRLFFEDVQGAVDDVNKAVKVSLTQQQFDSLVSFTFNLGGAALRGSTLLKMLNEGRHDQAADQFRLWVHAGGKKVAGLVNRREAERELWYMPHEGPVILARSG